MEDSDVCAHCGQPLPGRNVVSYGRKGPNRTGLIVTVALHLLLVAVWLFQPKVEKHAPPKAGEAIVWLPPQPQKQTSKPAEQAPKKTSKAAPTPRLTLPRVTLPPLPNAITLPEVKPVEEKPQPPKKETKEAPPQEVDMQAYIEAQRKRRGAPAQTDQAEESEAARGTRNALANIAAINGRSRDSGTTEGTFSYKNKTFNSAELKLNIWNPNFKRRWLTSVTVERGDEPDIETALVKKMIEMIRKDGTKDFTWEYPDGRRPVPLSARPEDTQELMNFLYKEMFPGYKPPPR